MSKNKKLVVIEPNDIRLRKTWEFSEALKVYKTFVPEKIYKNLDVKFHKLEKSLQKTSSTNIVSKWTATPMLQKVLTLPDPVNLICTVFRAKNQKTGVTINYALLFSSEVKYAKEIVNITGDDLLVFHHYTNASSVISQDGEYRPGIFGYHVYERSVSSNKGIMDAIEKIIIHKFEEHSLNLEYENFFPQAEHESIQSVLDNKIIHTNLMIKYFCTYWLTTISKIYNKTQENHINTKNYQTVFINIEEDLKNYEYLNKKFGVDVVNKFINMLTKTHIFNYKTQEVQEFLNYAQGQKLLPLTVEEVQHPMNILYPTWLEMYINNLVGDFSINFISGNFSVMADWFYIKNNKEGLFDNEAQYQRMVHSQYGLSMNHKIREAQSITYIQKKNNAEFINDLFKDIHARLGDTFRFIKSNLLMGSVTLGVIMDNVGRTIYDVANISKSEEWSIVGDITKNYELINKFVFHILYSLVCLNYKGITHSDLHINNVTINHYQNTTGENVELFGVDDVWFKISSNGVRACIIDFSRCTVQPSTIDIKRAHFETRDDLETFVERQNRYISHKIETTFPTFYKTHAVDIDNVIKNKFDNFYKIYTVIDAYDFTNKLGKYFSDKATDEIKKFLSRIRDMAETIFTNYMMKLFTTDITYDYPIKIIMQEVFSENIINTDAEITDNIYEVWSANNDIACHLDNSKQWPEVLKSSYGMTSLDAHTKPLPGYDFIYDARVRYEKVRKKSMKMIEYIARRHREKYN